MMSQKSKANTLTFFLASTFLLLYFFPQTLQAQNNQKNYANRAKKSRIKNKKIKIAVRTKSRDEFLSEILAHYKSGEYVEAKEMLNKLKTKKSYQSISYYWLGLVENKLQNFDDSITNFEQAIKYKANFEDLYYEYGQAAYASFKYTKAYKAFEMSASLPYRPATSYYYMGFINVKKENYPQAIDDFKKAIKINSDDGKDNIKQAAAFQIAQIYVLQAERSKNPQKLVKKIVLPQLEDARGFSPSSPLAKDIDKQVYMLKEKFDLLPGKMNNGRPIPEKLYLVKLTQSTYYNSNVINEAGSQVNTVADNGSIVYDTTFLARKRMNFKKRYVLSPEFSVNNKYYSNRHTEKVSKNDQYNLIPGIEGLYEHKMFSRPASSIAAFEYNLSEQNRTNQNTRIFFSKMYTYTLGEAFHLFADADFTFKMKYKYFVSYDPSLHYSAWGFTATQSFKPGYRHTLSAFFSFDRNSYRTNNSLDSRIYTTRLDYFLSEFFRHYRLNLFTAVTLTDNINQVKTRGVERKFNPGTRVSRKFLRDQLNVSAHYAYTRQVSRNKASFDYEQWAAGIDLAYTF